jgi:HrpA-like RNA helicase
LKLSSENPVSKFAFKFILYHYTLDPKDAAAQLAAANEAAAAAAAKRFPGVFVGASFSVAVERDEKIQECREGLPILGAEHDIVDAINTNPITVICGKAVQVECS